MWTGVEESTTSMEEVCCDFGLWTVRGERCSLSVSLRTFVERNQFFRAADPLRHDASMSARSETLSAIPAVAASDGTFTVQEVVDEMNRRGTNLLESTISTHIRSRMCRNAPDNHATTFDDVERVDRGLYRLVGL